MQSHSLSFRLFYAPFFALLLAANVHFFKLFECLKALFFEFLIQKTKKMMESFSLFLFYTFYSSR